MPKMNPTYTEIVPLTPLAYLDLLGEHLHIRAPTHPEIQAVFRPILFAMPPIAVVVVVVCGLCVCVPLCQCNATKYFKRLLCFLGKHLRIRASTHPDIHTASAGDAKRKQLERPHAKFTATRGFASKTCLLYTSPSPRDRG